MKNSPLLAPHLPLFDFFQAIRQWEATELSRQALTSREYEWIIPALDNCPFELKDKDDYYRLCKLLWFKPYHADRDSDTDGTSRDNREGVGDRGFRNQFDVFWTYLEDYLAIEKEEIVVKPPIEASTARTLLDNNLNSNPIEEVEQTANVLKKTAIKNNATLSNVWVSTSDAASSDANSENAKQRVKASRSFSFLEKNKFLPLEVRRLYQLLLSVRKVVYDGPRNVLDFEETIKTYSRQGYINQFSLSRQPRMLMDIHVLVDHEGSMVAFEMMSDIITEFVQFVGGQNSTVWYFHNCPSDYLFEDKTHFEALDMQNWLLMLDDKAPAQVLIFSDGGAARGYRNTERIVATERFLKSIRKHQVVWLNPIPERRWTDTAAVEISRYVEMYDTTDREFVAAMQRLKGK